MLLRRNKATIFSLFFLTLVILSGIFASLLSPHDPTLQDLNLRLKPPFWAEGGSSDLPLGADQMGRDILSRLFFGARISLVVGVTAVLFSMGVGVMAGLLAGFYPRVLGLIVMRLADIQLSFPSLLVALALVVVLRGKHGTGSNVGIIIVILGVTGWVTYARVVRAQVLAVSEMDYVASARMVGCRDMRIVFLHILPNVVTPIIVLATLQVATVIITESSLSFLGVGIQPPTPTWGGMLSDGKMYLRNAWWLATFPGLAIFLTVLSINFVGDWLRDTFDPYMQARMGEGR